MQEFAQILINSSGAVAAVFISYLYLEKLTNRFFQSLDENNKTVARLSHDVDVNSSRVNELTNINHEMYRVLMKKTEKMVKNGIDPTID